MQTKPLLYYKAPVYPRIERVLTEPDMLLRNMPKAWKANKLIVTAMVTFSVAACKGQTSDAQKVVNSNNIAMIDSENDWGQFIQEVAAPDTSKVAPIFVHGDGVGVSGCVMIAPPVYLSEEDALEIIFSELKKEGLTFDDQYDGDSLKIKRNLIEYVYNEKSSDFDERVVEKIEVVKMFPDAYNKELNLIIEFVSIEDYFNYGDEVMETSSVSEFRIMDAANKIQKVLKEKGGANSVVFYDPVGWADNDDYSRDWDKLEKEGREKAVEMLKLQVSDFIDWLKKENLIKKQ